MYSVNDIFFSLQGEGFHTGRAAVFVRFAGCNLRCPWCDTDFSHHTPMTAEQIAERVFSYSTDPRTLIVLTGGEPSLQVDSALLSVLHRHHQTITIETNGTHPIPDDIDWITLSPKADSTVVLTRADELKLVYDDQPVEAIQQWLTAIPARHYFLQPCSCRNTDAVVAFILAHPQWQLSLQTHKYIHIP